MSEQSTISYNASVIERNFTIPEASTSEIVFSLGTIDSIIVVIYMIISIGIGLYVGRKQKNADDYFLAGRNTTWPFVGLSLFATNVSSSSCVGLAGAGYRYGISVYNYIWTSCIMLIIFSTFFLPTILRSKVHTLPEILEIRYNAGARCYFSILTTILSVFGSIGGSLYGGALVVKMVFPQLEIWQIVAILALLAGMYTVVGGLAAVIYTDALQAIVMMLGSILIFAFALNEVGGWNAMISQVPNEKLKLYQPADSLITTPWTGVVFGISVNGFYFWCTNQSIVQRILSAKSSKHGRWGAIFSGFWNLPLLFFMVLPGTIASVIFKDLPKTDLVYPTLMFNLLPVGVLGIALSGFTAAMISDIDSELNSASTLITMDIIKKMKPGLKSNQLMKIGRVITLILTIISACWAPVIGNFESLYQFLQKFLSYIISPIVALYVVGFFWRGANSRAAIIALISGNVVSGIMFLLNEVFEVIKVHFLHIAPILLLFSSLVLIGVSLFIGEKCSDEQLAIVWSPNDLLDDFKSLQGYPIWKNYHLHSLLLFISTAIVVGLFW